MENIMMTVSMMAMAKINTMATENIRITVVNGDDGYEKDKDDCGDDGYGKDKDEGYSKDKDDCGDNDYRKDKDECSDDWGARAPPLLTSHPPEQGLLMAPLAIYKPLYITIVYTCLLYTV